MEELDKNKTQSASQDQKLRELKSIGLIINAIVHSFNNAIGLIRGYADLSLRVTDPDSRGYPYLKNIIDGTDSVKELSEKMRIFGKQEKQDLKVTQIHSIVEEAINLFAMSLASPIKIQKNIDATCGAILADADQIHQVVVNLCRNAYHAIRDKEGVIEVILKEINVDASFIQVQRELNEGRYLKLTIKDAGVGIDQDVLGRIFEPFFTTQKTEESAGLGLTVVQGIVKNHQGKIIVESKLGEGATFDIYFPLVNENYEKGYSL